MKTRKIKRGITQKSTIPEIWAKLNENQRDYARWFLATYGGGIWNAAMVAWLSYEDDYPDAFHRWKANKDK